MEGKNSLIRLAKENIYHLFPKVTSMDISMTRLANNCYKSKIILKTKMRSFFVLKEAQNYKESLDKSCDAMKKQLKKVKVNKVHQTHSQITFEDELDPSSDEIIS